MKLQGSKQCSVSKRVARQMNRTEQSPETDPHKSSQLTFDKEHRQFDGERTDFSTNCAETMVIHTQTNAFRHRPYKVTRILIHY